MTLLTREIDYAGHVAQHCPFDEFGSARGLVHMVGKHHTFGQKVLAFPPLLPVAPVIAASSLMFGFTQYGQQWPSTSVAVKPAGHFKLAVQVMPAQGSLIPLDFCTAILVFMSRSSAMIQLPVCSWLRSRLARTSF